MDILKRVPAQRVHDRLSLVSCFAKPEPRLLNGQKACPPLYILGLHVLETADQRGRDRIVNRDGHNADNEGHNNRRHKKLPDGDTRCARDDQFLVSVEFQKGCHAANQNSERHDLPSQCRQSQQCHSEADPDTTVFLVGQPPHDLDKISQENNGQANQK